MTNPTTAFRALLIYAICLPLAIFVGYVITNPLDLGTFGAVGFIFVILSLPILLRFHHPLVIVSWNASMMLFFLPGGPHLWLAAVAASLCISVARRTIDPQFRFIWVPQVTWPLIVLAVIALVTAKLTGMGLRVFGGESFGGRRYIYLVGGILGYFALTAQRIPPERAGLCVALFFLSGVTNLIGDFFTLVSTPFKFIFLFFPPTDLREVQWGVTRVAGLTAASAAIYSFMMAKYGIRGIFASGKPWRAIILILFSGLGLLGGFRSLVIHYIVTFCFQFFLEGMHKTKLLPTFVLGGAVLAAATLPFLQRLPLNVQRSFAFLPVTIDPIARQTAKESTEWRLNMWKALLPQVPQYLWLGKGYRMAPQDFDYARDPNIQRISEDQWGATLAGDYHNGPLSVIITFGLWGAIAFIWFLFGAYHVFYRNYRYGDPSLKVVNTMFFALYLAKLVIFFFVVGGFQGDMQLLAGWLGLSVALNGGVAKPALATAQAEAALTSREPGSPLAKPVGAFRGSLRPS